MCNFVIRRSVVKDVLLHLITFFSVSVFSISKKKVVKVETMTANAARTVLKQGKSVLLICDVQERFAKAMFEFDKIVKNSSKLVNILNYFKLRCFIIRR